MGNAYGLLGYINHARGSIDKAEYYYRKASEKGMTKDRFKLAYGVLLLGKENYGTAKELFRDVLLYNKNEKIKLTAKQNLALAHWKLGDIDTAVELLWEVHRRFKNGKLYGTLGYLLIVKGDLEGALKYNLEALGYDNRDPVIVNNLAQSYYHLGNIDQAKRYFLTALQLKEDSATALYYLGLISSAEGDDDAAREFLEKALECNISPLSAVSRAEIEKKLKEIS